MNSRVRAWLQMMRLPNLFTVPGDPLAGYFFASLVMPNTPNFVYILPCVASVLLYISGLLFNDYFDRDIDAKERPGRPIPSGRVRPGNVLAAAIVLMAVGIAVTMILGLYPILIVGALALLILTYNAGLKRIPLIGPLNMGLCRGVSLLLGASVILQAEVFNEYLVLAAAAGVTLYIAAVTAIALKETGTSVSRIVSVLPVAAVVVLFTSLIIQILPAPWYVFAIPAVPVLATLIWTVMNAIWAFNPGSPENLQKIVGNLIRGLLLIQAALCVLFNWQGLIAAVILVLLFPLSWLTAKKFYAS